MDKNNHFGDKGKIRNIIKPVLHSRYDLIKVWRAIVGKGMKVIIFQCLRFKIHGQC